LIWSKGVREPDLLDQMFAQVRETGR